MVYTLVESPQEFEQINKQCKGIIDKLFAELTPFESGQKLPSESIVQQDTYGKGTLCLIREGVMACRYNDRTLLYCEPQDLIGIEYCYHKLPIRYCAQFAVVVDCYRISDLHDLLGSDSEMRDLWQYYLTARSNLLLLQISGLVATDTAVVPVMRSYQAGEVIIKEGEEADDVFALLNGKAEVFHKDVKVGEVLRDEIFGATACLANTARTATVVASCESTALVLPADHFIDLANKRPTTVMQLVKDMARTVVSLNEKVVKLEKTKSTQCLK